MTNGKATWTFSPNLADGTYTVTAAYTPDGSSNYTGSDSTANPLTEVVGGLASQTTLTASANFVKSGTLVTFTLTVAPASGSGAVPTGTVTVVDQSDPSLFNQTFTLDGTKTTFTFTVTMTAPPQLDSFVATYSGDLTYCGSKTQLVEWIRPVWPVPQPVLGGLLH